MFKRWSDYFILLAGIGITVGIGIYFYVPLPVRVKRLSRSYRSGDYRSARAARILKEMGEKTLPALTRQLADKHREIQLDALKTLELLSDRRYAVIIAMQKLLGEPDWQVRKLSAIRLGQPAWYHPSSMKYLNRAYSKEKEWTVRRVIIESIGKLGLMGLENSARESLNRGLEDPEWSVRVEALKYLIRLTKWEESGERFAVQMLDDPKANVRRAALKIIAQQKDFTPELVPALFSLYQREKDERNRKLIISIFQEFPAQPLKEALDMEGKNVVSAVTEIALFSKKVREKGLERLLFEQLTDSPHPIQRRILFTLSRISPNGISLFIKALKLPSQSVRIAAAKNLYLLSKYSVLALPELKELLQSNDFTERFAAVQALEKLPPPLPILREISLGPNLLLQKMALRTAIFFGPKAILLIIEALSSKSPELRLMAVRALKAYPKQLNLFLKPLAKKISDPDEKVKVQAFRSLLALGEKAQKQLFKELFSLPLHKQASIITALPSDIVTKLNRENLSIFFKRILLKIYEYPVEKKLPLLEVIKHIPDYHPQLETFFKAFLNAPESSLRDTALRTLLSLNPPIRRELLAKLDSELRSNIKNFHPDRTPKALKLFAELAKEKNEKLKLFHKILLQNKNLQIKRALLNLLKRDKQLSKKMLPTLIRFLKKRELWGLLFKILSQAGPLSFKELRPLFHHPKASVKWGAIELLSLQKNRSPELTPYIERWKKDPDLAVRSAALRLEKLLLSTQKNTQSTPRITPNSPSPTTQPK